MEKIYNFDYTGSYYHRLLKPGLYKFECWGASGGDILPKLGGKGAYVSGIISFNIKTNIYIYPGGQGQRDGKEAFNGGGAGKLTREGSEETMMPSGGGGSDIRLKLNDYNSRIIVAGGGGAAVYVEGWYETDGGTGGGLKGFIGVADGPNLANLSSPAIAGSQTASGEYASFGKGGSNTYSGGGGGYYGGGCSTSVHQAVSSGAGGSSYISGYYGCIWKGSESSIHESLYYFTNYIMKDGIDTFQSPNGQNETGHSGNGYVRITLLHKSRIISPCFKNDKNYFRTFVLIFSLY